MRAVWKFPACHFSGVCKILRLFAGVALVSATLALPAASLPSGFSSFRVAQGIANPTAMEFAPDGRIFVCQQNGQLRVIKNHTLLSTPFVTVVTTSTSERGLLGIAFDPGFETNNYLYVYYTATSPTTHNRVSRFTANGDLAVPGSEFPILDLETLSAGNHNGGAIHFGADGKLYVAVGENAVTSNSQSLSNRLGKMLRINPDGSIPTDNPFYNSVTPINRSIWARGLRNPFTFAVQPGTGRIFINDVGNKSWEEINEGVAGANYGWPSCEGRCNPPNASMRNPFFLYAPGDGETNGCSITGGTFYNPIAPQYPAQYHGTYFFADACGGWIRRVDPQTGSAFNFVSDVGGVVDLKVSPEGRLFYLTRDGGEVWGINYTAGPPTLGVTQKNGEGVAFWPAPATGFELQSSDTLPGTSWATITQGVLTTNGQKRATFSATGNAKFFRLVRP